MDLKQLEYFVRVAESGSFTRAAAVLDISQPSLSRQIRLLELELREHLLYRTGRGVELTDAGRCLFKHGTHILETVRVARQDIEDLKAAPDGRITVGLPQRVAHVLTPTLVQAFRTALPRAAITVTEGLSANLKDWLIEGRLDIALLYEPPATPKLEVETVFREEMILVGRASARRRLPEKVRLEALSAYPLVLPCRPHTIRMLVETTCRAKGVALNVVAEVDAVQTLVALAESGDTYAILPESAVLDGVRKKRLCAARIHAPAILNTLSLATARHRPLSRLGKETTQLLRTIDVARLLIPQGD